MRNRQRKIHITTELLALVVVAPVTAYIAASNPQLPAWQRNFLYATAIGTIIVDGWLLNRWLKDD